MENKIGLQELNKYKNAQKKKKSETRNQETYIYT